MNIKSVALKALQEIIDKKISYHIVMGKIEEENNFAIDDHTKLVRLVFGALRHFESLSWEIKECFSTLKSDDDELYLFVISLYEIRYMTKTVALSQVLEDLEICLLEQPLKIEAGPARKALTKLSKGVTPIPQEIRDNFVKFNSLKYDTPIWIIKMWQKHYGEKETLNILKAIKVMPISTIAVNTLIADIATYTDDSRFQNNLASPTAFDYPGPLKLSELEEVIDGKIFALDGSRQNFIDELYLKPNDKVLHLGGVSGAIDGYIAIKMLDKGVVDCTFDSPSKFRRAKYFFNRLELKSPQPILTDLKLVKTYYMPIYDYVIVTPATSKFGEARRRPDLLITFNQDNLDRVISRAYQFLDEASHYVVKGGHLAYGAPVLNDKEATGLIAIFLSNHQNFRLVKERQIFPDEFGTDGYYYAILERTK